MTKQEQVRAFDSDHADELNVLLELSALLARHDLPIAEVLSKTAELLLRLLQQVQPGGALVQWRGQRYTAGTVNGGSSMLRAELATDEDRESYLAVTVDERFANVAENYLSLAAQTALEHAAAIISLSMQHRELESERDALQHRKWLLERIISHSPVVAFILDPSDGWPVLYVSDNVAELGYPATDFESGRLNYEDIIHPDDRQRVITEVKSKLESGLSHFEQRYRIMTSSDEVRLVRDWSLVSRDKDNKVVSIAGIIRDLSALADDDARARRQLELTNNIFLILNAQNLVVDANDRACDLLGVVREDLIGSNWLERYVPEDRRAAARDHFQQARSGDLSGVQEYENEIVSASGERIRVHWYYTIELDKAANPGNMIAFGADVSELRHSEETSRKHSQLLMQNPNPVLRLSHDGDVVTANSAAQHLLGDIAASGNEAVSNWQKLVAAAIGPAPCATTELSVGDRVYVFMIASDATDNVANLYGLDVSEEKELSTKLRTIADNMPGAVFEYTLAPDGTDSIEYMNPGCEDIWEVPAAELSLSPKRLWALTDPADLPGLRQSVLDSARSLGHWEHEWRIRPASGTVKWLRSSGSPEKRDDGSVRWTTIVVDVTATKIAHEAVSEALRKTIYVLSAALEARDPYTAGHEQRVTTIAVQIGRKLKLDLDRLTGLELAAMVHDVGKIRIPAEILSKPGRLSKEEFELIKTHPAVGAELLKDIDFDWPISDIIRQHHERLDGSGYPDGLAGEEILLEARIIAVADTLEAMASHRPYRPGLGIDKAAAEIRAGAGIRYDPLVARTCLQLVANGTIDLSPASANATRVTR